MRNPNVLRALADLGLAGRAPTPGCLLVLDKAKAMGLGSLLETA
jgi:hypothetical protein